MKSKKNDTGQQPAFFRLRCSRHISWQKSLITTALLLSQLTASAWDGATDAASWTQVKTKVANKKIQLNHLIERTKNAGLSTDYAMVSRVVTERFQTYMQYDRNHSAQLKAAVDGIWWRTKFDSANYHTELPFDEAQDCIDVLNYAIAELQQQLNGNIKLASSPDLSKGTLQLGTTGTFLRNGKPFFASDFTWMPSDEDLMGAFGRMGGMYYSINDVLENGTVKSSATHHNAASLSDQKDNHIAPQQFFIGHGSVPAWMSTAHPEVLDGARNFTKYDTDSPYIRSAMTDLFNGMISQVCAAAGNQPRMHLLANEPDWATRQGGWLADHGVSANTMEKYSKWLVAKYGTIARLNTTYGKSYPDFYAAKNAMTMPIPASLQGGPIWYDWCRFNQCRINDWFSFLKKGVQNNDPNHSPVTIKLIGGTMLNAYHDNGLDMEYLTNLLDVLGSDFKVIPNIGVVNINIKDTEWMDRYAFDWRQQSLVLDFTKSLCPNKAFYDSEWHGLSASNWRHMSMDRDYVRSALWMGATHGISAMQSWVWARKNDGSFENVNSDFVGDVLTQPVALDAYGRTYKELNAHASSVAKLARRGRQFMIYYSEDSAIQDTTYTAQMTTVYEGLKLLNAQVGFTTPSQLGTLSKSSQVLVIPPMHYISNTDMNALKTFKSSGGTVVQINGSKASFRRTEHGVWRNTIGFTPTTSISLGNAETTADRMKAALGGMIASQPVAVTIQTPAKENAYGVIASQYTASGKTTMSLINVSKYNRFVTLKTSSGGKVTVKNALTGKTITANQTMAPCDVLFLQVTAESTATDDLTAISAPSTISAGSQSAVTVHYSAAKTRDLHLNLISRSSWKTIAETVKPIHSGTGSASISLTVPSGATTEQYNWKAWISPTGGDWVSRLDEIAQTVTVTTGNASPTVIFSSPENGARLTKGSDLYVKVTASDSDGSISNIKLYLDNVPVRKESRVPYEWGAGSQNDPSLKNLTEGLHTLKAVATDNNGATSSQSIVVKGTSPATADITMHRQQLSKANRYHQE